MYLREFQLLISPIGAGGIVGMANDSAMDLYQWDRVTSITVVIFAMTLIIVIVAAAIRKCVI